jgi:acetyl esterase/lipase
MILHTKKLFLMLMRLTREILYTHFSIYPKNMQTASIIHTIRRRLACSAVCIIGFTSAYSQLHESMQKIFPENTKVYGNIPYAADTSHFHLLDIYVPANTSQPLPLVVWIHGGAWMLNDKYADMGYMKNTVRNFLDSGYALASIDYRYSTTAPFPAQVQDCNQAIQFLYDHAAQYHVDKNRIALIGFSAGGHLASLLGLSNNNAVSQFYPSGKKPSFQIRTVIDFYGPSDFVVLGAGTDTSINNDRNAVSILLGALPLERPDLAKKASPVTYIDKNDPPFLIVQGEKDESVPYTQSVMLHSWLQLAGVKNDIIVVKDAPHYGPMFDAANIRSKIFQYLRSYLR